MLRTESRRLPSEAKGRPFGAVPCYSGSRGRQLLISCVRRQSIVSDNSELARSLCGCGVLQEVPKGDVLTRQGDPDNDILLIVHGEVSITVNDRVVANRHAGTHVGEMALVDPLATRSATVVAVKPTVVLRVPEHKFSALGKKHPSLWRRIASELANRLRERNRYLAPPHNRPVLFIGSSSEGLPVLDAVHSITRTRKVVPRPWTNGVFEASSTAIESLLALSREADFAALILTADDAVISRGRRKYSPRDNVVFELGLLMGAIGRERVFILKPHNVDIRIPSDLLGLMWLEYKGRGPSTLVNRLRPPCSQILKRIAALGPK